LGAIIGGLLAGALSDLFGRKPVTLLSSVIFVIGAALMTFAHQYWLLLLGRVVVGVGVGKSKSQKPTVNTYPTGCLLLWCCC